MRNVWFLWNPELVRPVWIAGMSILLYLNFVSFVLLCLCFLFVKEQCKEQCNISYRPILVGIVSECREVMLSSWMTKVMEGWG